MTSKISVITPAYNAPHFIARALRSLFAQTFTNWQLILIDDGSQESLCNAVGSFLPDPRVILQRFEQNRGLGAALNAGLALAEAPYVAYLPADDVYFGRHLESLLEVLEADPAAVLAYSGLRYHSYKTSTREAEGHTLQPVQVLHRRTSETWVERSELVTDDLDLMYWNKLRPRGTFVPTDQISCEWVDHPHQRHKILREPEGGINLYRRYYHVTEPLRIQTRNGNPLDERTRFKAFRDRIYQPAPDGLRILLLGELAYNSERVLALAEAGHTLFGLWIDNPHFYNAVGPVPFGHIQDLDSSDWQAELRRVKPDVIYALLNWQSVSLVRRVLAARPDIPAVWHFKEGPFACIEKGLWPELTAIYQRADGSIFCCNEMRRWISTALPFEIDEDRTLILDGDLPKADWFSGATAPKLSESDGELHTVVPGRPLGLTPETVGELANHGIHLHLYGDFVHGQWRAWIERSFSLAPKHLHLHGHVDQERWVPELSRYDAGWLHVFQSDNQGEIMRANWDDLNVPARIPTLIAAGLPLLQRDNFGSVVAMQSIAKDWGLGIFFKEPAELALRMHDRKSLDIIQRAAWAARDQFTFDFHVERLTAFFRHIIASKTSPNRHAPFNAAATCLRSSPNASPLCKD